MQTEIERKFLCSKIPFDLSGFKNAEILQGYISICPVVRLRSIGGEFFLTVKSQGDLVRQEMEMSLTGDQFNRLWAKTEPGTISKIRYFIPLEDGLTAELDIYGGHLQGLITIEVEFKTEAAAKSFKPPGWFGKEVTGDHRFSNNQLSLSKSYHSF